MAKSSCLRLSPNGSFTVKKALGEEPEKAYFVVASGANTTARVFVDYGDYPEVRLRNGAPTPAPPEKPARVEWI